VALTAQGCGRGEEAPAFLGRCPFLHELEEDASWRPTPRPVFGQHATVGLTLKRVRENGGGPVYPEHAQDLQE
jgi:hypothetical protein